MRILVVSYDYQPPIGGMGDTVTHTVAELRRTHPECQVSVLCPTERSDVPVPGWVQRRHGRRFGCPFFSFYLLLGGMKNALQVITPDVVHAHAGSGGVFVLQRPAHPLLVTAHHTYIQEVRYVFRSHPIKMWTKWLMSFLERRTYQIATRVTAVSADTKDALVRDYGIDEEKIDVLENAVVVRESLHTTPRSQTIVSIGRLETRKGTEEMLRGFALLKQSHPDATLRLAGSNLLGHRLQQLLRSLGLEGSVELLGYISDEQLQHELSSAACVLVPSRLEGFGLIAAQAMMLGSCVVAANVPGLRSLIEHEKTGLLFPIDDPKTLAACVSFALDHPEEARQIGTRAKQAAEARFSLSRQTQALFDLYHHLLAL